MIKYLTSRLFHRSIMINVIRCGGVLYFLFMWFASLVSYSHTYRYVVKLYEHLHKKKQNTHCNYSLAKLPPEQYPWLGPTDGVTSRLQSRRTFSDLGPPGKAHSRSSSSSPAGSILSRI